MDRNRDSSAARVRREHGEECDRLRRKASEHVVGHRAVEPDALAARADQHGARVRGLDDGRRLEPRAVARDVGDVVGAVDLVAHGGRERLGHEDEAAPRQHRYRTAGDRRDLSAPRARRVDDAAARDRARAVRTGDRAGCGALDRDQVRMRSYVGALRPRPAQQVRGGEHRLHLHVLGIVHAAGKTGREGAARAPGGRRCPPRGRRHRARAGVRLPRRGLPDRRACPRRRGHPWRRARPPRAEPRRAARTTAAARAARARARALAPCRTPGICPRRHRWCPTPRTPRSTTHTRSPAALSRSAQDAPTIPAPTTTTSTRVTDGGHRRTLPGSSTPSTPNPTAQTDRAAVSGRGRRPHDQGPTAAASRRREGLSTGHAGGPALGAHARAIPAVPRRASRRRA